MKPAPFDYVRAETVEDVEEEQEQIQNADAADERDAELGNTGQ